MARRDNVALEFKIPRATLALLTNLPFVYITCYLKKKRNSECKIPTQVPRHLLLESKLYFGIIEILPRIFKLFEKYVQIIPRERFSLHLFLSFFCDFVHVFSFFLFLARCMLAICVEIKPSAFTGS